jgi:cell division protein FtsL
MQATRSNMSLTTKLLLGLIVVLSGAALYMYFFGTKKVATPDTTALANATAQQGTQLTALNSQVQDKVSRTELANIIQKTQLPLVTTSPIGPDEIDGVAADTFINNLKTQLTN